MNVFLPMGERIPKHTTLQGLPEPIWGPIAWETGIGWGRYIVLWFLMRRNIGWSLGDMLMRRGWTKCGCEIGMITLQWLLSNVRDTEIMMLKLWYWNYDAGIMMLKLWYWNYDAEIAMLKCHAENMIREILKYLQKHIDFYRGIWYIFTNLQRVRVWGLWFGFSMLHFFKRLSDSLFWSDFLMVSWFSGGL